MNKVDGNFPISFSEAVKQAEPLLKNKRSSWLSKKVFLAYSEIEGWKVKELGLFDRALRGLNLAHRDTHLAQVTTALDELTLDEVSIIPESGLLEKMPALMEKVNTILNDRLFPSPLNKTTPPILLETKLPVSPKKEIKKQVSIASGVEGGKMIEGTTLPKAIAPLSLVNYNASRCYTDSVMEMILSQDSIRQKIFEAKKNISQEIQDVKKEIGEIQELKKGIGVLEVNESSIEEGMFFREELVLNGRMEELKKKMETLEKKEKILDALIEVIQKAGSIAQKKSKVEVGITSPGEKVREAIFNNPLHDDLQDKNAIYQQQDAAAAMELLLGTVLNISVTPLDIDVAKHNNIDLEIQRNPESQTALKIPIENGGNITDLIANSMGLKENKNWKGELEKRAFNIDGNEVQLPFSTKQAFQQLPETLCMHILRYDNEGNKVRAGVTLPENGIIDLSPYYSGSEKGDHKYEITGYVMHSGNSLKGGHYTSNVKIGNEYFNCDDGRKKEPYKKISAKEFYGNTNSYLLMLKKVSD